MAYSHQGHHRELQAFAGVQANHLDADLHRVELPGFLAHLVRQGTVQRELAGLAAAGLLTVHKQGNQTHFQANTASLVFAELHGLVLKTMGLADVLRHALAPLSGQTGSAFVFGSIAEQQDTAGSDVDLLIVSDTIGYGDLMAALEDARQTLARAINPVLYSEAEFQRRLQEDNAFLTRVMQQPKIWLIGDHVPSQDGLILNA